jgi:uncharacterized protein YcaQ
MSLPSAPLHISAEQARRFLVGRHLLDPPRSLPAQPASVLEVIRRLGSLQFDPIEVTGARNHDLVLHNRIAGYRREWADAWLYGPDRRLVELYNKSLNLLPLAELPYYRLAWDHAAERYADGILREQAELVEAVVQKIIADGPVSTDAFRHLDHRVDWWWAETRVARAVMEALFVSGRLGIARRDGNRRYYDLVERLFPADLLALRVSRADSMRHRLLSRHRAVGLMAVGGGTDLVTGTGSAADRTAMTAELVDEGVLLPVQVDGLRERRYILAEELPLLEAAAAARAAVGASVSFVAPLDPLLWDRRLLQRLFGFDYTWEIYTPAPKRRFGYYALPILFGDRFVGRIEPRLERKTATLRVLGIWFEDAFEPMQSPAFVPALRDAMDDYRRFVGARSVTWPRSNPGRHLAGELRRLQP